MHQVTLQISLAPSDFRHSKYLLRHQLTMWASQVNEILLTYDTHRSKGRFGNNWVENHRLMANYLKDIIKEFPTIRLLNIDYAANTRKEVAKSFFKTAFIPAKDFRGGPFYTYFYGLYAATYEYVLHIDSDMFFGGGSPTWVQEAIALMQSRKDILLCSPLPGPPRKDGALIGQHFTTKFPLYCAAFAFNSMSTRIFLIDRGKLKTNKLTVSRPSVRSILKAYLQGNPAYDLPENIISNYMKANKLVRVDFLGNQPGMWSIHPPYRTETFYSSIPDLIKRITNNDVPSDQAGFYDMTDSLCDWTEARSKLKDNRWYKKF